MTGETDLRDKVVDVSNLLVVTVVTDVVVTDGK